MGCLTGQKIDHSVITFSNLRAGDVHVGDIVTSNSTNEGNVADEAYFLPLSLDLTVPIFDENTGVLFGAVILTIDIEYLLNQKVNGVNAEHVMLADHDGCLMSCSIHNSPTLDSTASFPSFFKENSGPYCLRSPDGDWPNGLFAVKIRLDRSPQRKPIVLLIEGEPKVEKGLALCPF